MPLPPRRWFAFRLRTLFAVVAVVALPLGWVAYSLNWIRERQAVFAHNVVAAADPHKGPRSAPRCLWVFGERGWSFIAIETFKQTPLYDRDPLINRTRRLFPEAYVTLKGSHWHLQYPPQSNGP